MLHFKMVKYVNFTKKLIMNVLRNWNIMRLVRLVLAIGITIHAFKTEEYFFLFFALFFFIQVIFNKGCQSNCSF